MSSRTSSTPPRTIEQFCAQHNLTFTPSITKMTLAELSHLYRTQSYEPLGAPPDNRAPVILADESEEVNEPPPITYQPDPINWRSLGGGSWVGHSTRRNLAEQRRAVTRDRINSLRREDAQWAKI